MTSKLETRGNTLSDWVRDHGQTALKFFQKQKFTQYVLITEGSNDTETKGWESLPYLQRDSPSCCFWRAQAGILPVQKHEPKALKIIKIWHLYLLIASSTSTYTCIVTNLPDIALDCCRDGLDKWIPSLPPGQNRASDHLIKTGWKETERQWERTRSSLSTLWMRPSLMTELLIFLKSSYNASTSLTLTVTEPHRAKQHSPDSNQP